MHITTLRHLTGQTCGIFTEPNVRCLPSGPGLTFRTVKKALLVIKAIGKPSNLISAPFLWYWLRLTSKMMFSLSRH